MPRSKRVYVSVPRDHNLDQRQRAFKHLIYAELRRNGLEPQEFQVCGLPTRAPYTFEGVREVMSRCHGVLILAFARWVDPVGGHGVAIPTVWNHFEGAFAVALRKEILVITEEHVAEDGITWAGGSQIILRAPQNADRQWLEDGYAKPQIEAYINAVKQIDDVFLAYSSKATGTAALISRFLTSRGVAVRDWQIDFAPGPTILEELQSAVRNSLGAIMLLTKDDEFAAGSAYKAAPRDNVVFEMGMFMEAKGRNKVLVILEEGAKLPADVGGGIYIPLTDRNNIDALQVRMLDFIDNRI